MRVRWRQKTRVGIVRAHDDAMVLAAANACVEEVDGRIDRARRHLGLRDFRLLMAPVGTAIILKVMGGLRGWVLGC